MTEINIAVSSELQRWRDDMASMSQSSELPLLQQRRQARQLNDAHHVHPLRRTYIGPSPVGARSAASMAALIAHDADIDHPFKVSVIDAQGRVHMATEQDKSDDVARSSIDSAAAAVRQQNDPQPPQTPSKRTTELSPLHIPRSNHLLRWNSRSSSVANPSTSNAFTASPHPLTPTRSRSARRLMSQSLVDDRQASGNTSNLPGVKFDLHPSHQRRQYSESSAYDHRSVSQRNRAALPLLDVSVDEEGPHTLHTPDSSPQKTTASQLSTSRALDVAGERNVRHASSFQSFGGRSNASTTRRFGGGVRKQPSASTVTIRKKQSTDGSMIDRGFDLDGDQTTDTAMFASDAPDTSRTEWTGNALSDSETLDRRRKKASRLEVMRERARRRYRTSKFDQAVESSLQAREDDSQVRQTSKRWQHGRDVSRQSRASYVSAAGTQTSVGTRFTEGSFGANGGFRAKIVRSFGFEKKDRAPTTQSVRAEARRRGRHSSSSRGGVIPGAVGTSAGGTKWIGQSFEIGKRFRDALENREEYLCSTPDALLAVVREEEVNDVQRPKKTPNVSLTELDSPDDVLSKYAHEASQSQDDEQQVKRGNPSMRALAPMPPADKQSKANATKANGSANLQLKGSEDEPAPPERALTRYQSAASLLTIPQDREVQSKFDIESRMGWSDVVSFVTAQSQLPASIQRNARSASDNLSDMGGKAKRAFDNHMTDIRARNAAQERRRKVDTGSDEIPLKQVSPVDVLQKPAAPLDQKIDGALAEATFELTRRPSWPGVPANGNGQLNDAASDHEVAARPTMESTAKNDEQGRQPRSALSTAKGALRQKKSVQFGSGLPKRSMTVEDVTATKLLHDGSPGEENKLQILAGRLRPAVRSGDAAPAPPEEVLSRPPSPSQILAADRKTTKYLAKEAPSLKEALKRDRMLVKVAWTPSEDVPKEFTERISRKYEMHADPFREFMVVFRAGRLELWDDPSLTSRAIGHGERLKLRYIAPLRRGRAFISLFSSIDSIFCLSFVADHHRSLFNLRRSGTHLWLFDARAASNSADWMWELWRELGGQIPEAIDVHIPVMGTRVRVPIPDQIIPSEAHVARRPLSVSHKTQNSKRADTDDSDETLFGEGYKTISLKNVVSIVTNLLRTFTQWYELSVALQRAGMQFGLAWRTNLRLNWVQHSTTVEGQRRDWAVLVGDLLSDAKEHSVLEFRGKAHYPHMTKTLKGEELLEPAAIEGFIWRVKAVSGNLTRLYVSTHDGLLFVNRPSRAYPPDRYVATDMLQSHPLRRSEGSLTNLSTGERRARPRRNSKSTNNRTTNGNEENWTAMGRRVAELTTLVPNDLDELDAQTEAYRGLERRRLFEQVNASDGYVDVRDIFMIRSLDSERGLTRKPGSDDDAVILVCQDGGMENLEHHDTPLEEVDDDDVGGEEGYDLAKDRAALKRARQFEVMLINGRSVRFEAYSRSVAREWIMRLGDLARYWKRREKDDALSLMNASGFDERLYKRKAQPHHELRPFDKAADSDRLSPLLGRIWNWCVLDGCRNILRAGRLFTKKKPYTAFDSRYCILISGRILTYKLMTSNRTARARQNAGIFHKRQETVIHLRDSYVYSGKLSDHMLVNGRSDGAGAIGNFGGGSGGSATSTSRHTLPRVYADGMLSVDDDEECTFVIRYRPQRVNRPANPQVNVGGDADALSTKDGETAIGAPGVTTAKSVSITTLRDSMVNVIAMRARSKLERDLWVWAINTERERLVRDDPMREDKLRQNGKAPFKAHT